MRDIVEPLAQGWKSDRKYVEPIEEIFPKDVSPNTSAKVSMRRCYETSIHPSGFDACPRPLLLPPGAE